jgi:hypothetical protein
MVGPQNFFFGEVALLFICQERSSFHSYQNPSVLLFLLLLFGFRFCLDFHSDLVISFLSRYIFASGPCWFSSKELD